MNKFNAILFDFTIKIGRHKALCRTTTKLSSLLAHEFKPR